HRRECLRTLTIRPTSSPLLRLQHSRMTATEIPRPKRTRMEPPHTTGTLKIGSRQWCSPEQAGRSPSGTIRSEGEFKRLQQMAQLITFMTTVTVSKRSTRQGPSWCTMRRQKELISRWLQCEEELRD